jgi:hypothetical protein
MSDTDMDGRCTCGEVRFGMMGRPLFVHCCHCRWCQRETGSAFVINAMIEADRVVLRSGTPEIVLTPSSSGKGQKVTRCPRCRVALWSNYAGAGDAIRFVRVGTLNNPDLFPPEIHIFTASKQSWFAIPPAAPAVEAYYEREQYWPADRLERWRALQAKLAR